MQVVRGLRIKGANHFTYIAIPEISSTEVVTCCRDYVNAFIHYMQLHMKYTCHDKVNLRATYNTDPKHF